MPNLSNHQTAPPIDYDKINLPKIDPNQISLITNSDTDQSHLLNPPYFLVFFNKLYPQNCYLSLTKKLFYNYAILHKFSPKDYFLAPFLTLQPKEAVQLAPGLYFMKIHIPKEENK